jgi:hypothetical protein
MASKTLLSWLPTRRQFFAYGYEITGQRIRCGEDHKFRSLLTIESLQVVVAHRASLHVFASTHSQPKVKALQLASQSASHEKLFMKAIIMPSRFGRENF